MSRESELAVAIDWGRTTLATMQGSQAVKLKCLLDAAREFQRAAIRVGSLESAGPDLVMGQPVTAELISEPDFTAEAFQIAATLLAPHFREDVALATDPAMVDKLHELAARIRTRMEIS